MLGLRLQDAFRNRLDIEVVHHDEGMSAMFRIVVVDLGCMMAGATTALTLLLAHWFHRVRS